MSQIAAPTSSLGPLARVAVGTAGAALVTMAAIQAWQVFARYVLNDAPSWTEPLALLCMSTTMMFGAAAGVHASRHFGFFIAVEHAPPRLSRVLQVIARAIAVAIGVMLALWGGQMMISAWDYEIAGAPLPQGVVYLPLCLGGALIAIFAGEQLIRLLVPASRSETPDDASLTANR
jgi:TRAP-type C4-dicarboxylate transport system permease small subunit